MDDANALIGATNAAESTLGADDNSVLQSNAIAPNNDNLAGVSRHTRRDQRAIYSLIIA